MFGFLNANKTSMKLTLDRQADSESVLVSPYHPGETVHASVRLLCETDVTIEEGRIALVCQERYQYGHSGSKGGTAYSWATDDREASRQAFLGQTSLAAGSQTIYEFDLRIPTDAIPSALAEIVQIRWVVRATLDRKRARDIEAIVELPVHVRVPAALSQRAWSAGSSKTSDAEMALSLPGRVWVMGETIEGSLQITPKKEFEVAGIRVELERREKVPRDRGHERAVVVGARHVYKTRLVPGHNRSLAFSIPIPSPAPATLRTPNGSVDWVLKGILDRSFRADTQVEEDLVVYNERP